MIDFEKELKKSNTYLNEIVEYIRLDYDKILETERPLEVTLELGRYVDNKFDICFTNEKGKYIDYLTLFCRADAIVSYAKCNFNSWKINNFVKTELGNVYGIKVCEIDEYSDEAILELMISILRKSKFDRVFDELLEEQREYYSNENVAARLLERK